MYKKLLKSLIIKLDNRYNFKIYFGIDKGDKIYDNVKNQNFIKDYIKNVNIDIDFIIMDIKKGYLSLMWNKLFKIAFNDNYDYFYQCGDDIIFNDKNMFHESISILNKNNNIGVSGSLTTNGNNNILTQSLVSRKHMKIFGFYFPSEIKNWYIDNWISDVYKPKYYLPLKKKSISNDGGSERYKIEHIDVQKIVEKYKQKIIKHINENKLEEKKSLNSVKFITLTNNGYIDYTLNCLKSLELIDFQENTLNCYAIGQDSYNILKLKGYKSILLNSDNNEDSKFNKFRTGNWHNIVGRKFQIIHKELLENKFVCFTDGDIVFLNKNFMNYCLDYIKDNDMVIQNDTLTDSDHNNLCSGFMFIKSSKKTIDIFDPKNVKKYFKPGWGDQIYVNQIKSKLKFRTLPLDLFPNGQYYYLNNKKIKPMMIHFNWVIGHKKKEKMKKYNKWYAKSKFKNFYNKNIQISKEVINDIFSNFTSNTKMLVFGLGYDSKMWYNGNKNTYFIENNDEYINMNINDIPKNNIIKYEYKINVKDSFQMSDDDLKKYIIPEKIKKLGLFDIIIIDGPEGWDENKPGRLIPYYWASKLSKKGTIIYGDDSSRKLEKYCINKFFKNKEKILFTQRNKCIKIIF